MDASVIVSRHFLRRSARRQALRLNLREAVGKSVDGGPGRRFYRLEKAARGLRRYHVIRVPTIVPASGSAARLTTYPKE